MLSRRRSPANLNEPGDGACMGAVWGDCDNDGWLDLFRANGNAGGSKSANYWYEYSKIDSGASAIIADAKNWPLMEGRSLFGFQKKLLLVNDKSGKFQEAAQAVGVNDDHDGRSVALSDLWNNGALDVLLATDRGLLLLLYMNTVDPANKWIEFSLEGVTSNRDAIGASVTLVYNGMKQRQEVSGGSGLCAQNSRRLHYGLGKAPKVEKAIVRWSSGQMQTLTSLATNGIVRVTEPSNAAPVGQREKRR